MLPSPPVWTATTGVIWFLKATAWKALRWYNLEHVAAAQPCPHWAPWCFEACGFWWSESQKVTSDPVTPKTAPTAQFCRNNGDITAGTTRMGSWVPSYDTAHLELHSESQVHHANI